MFLTLAAHWCELALVNALFFCLNATAHAFFYLGVRAWRALGVGARERPPRDPAPNNARTAVM